MKSVFIFLILASIATLSLAVPALLLDGKEATPESVSSTDAVETHQSTYVESLSSAPLSESDADEIAFDVQTSSSAKTGNGNAIHVKGWWFRVVGFSGTAGSQNIMQACAAVNMEAPCGHVSYVNHGGGCVPVSGFDGHWSIQSHVQAWGQSQELTNMLNHKYIFVGLGQYKQYSHYNTAGSHESGGIYNGQTYKNPGSGLTVCMSKSQPHSGLIVKGWRFQTVAFSGNAGSKNFMETCRRNGMEAPCDHPSYVGHGGGCTPISGLNGYLSIKAHVQAWGQSSELTAMMNHKYFFVGLGQYAQYSHYNTAGSHEGAGIHGGSARSRNPNGGYTVCVAPAQENTGAQMEFKGWWYTVVTFKGVAGSQNFMHTCNRLGLEAVCDHPSYQGHGGGCTKVPEFQGHFSYQPQLASWAQNDQFNRLMHHKYFFVGLNAPYTQYSHYNTAGSHEGAGIYNGGARSRNPDGGETVCISKNKYQGGSKCQVSSFGPWSPCSKSCGGGIQSRTRTVTKDGSQCPALKEEQACHAEACHTSTADIGKTVLAALQASLQKLTTTNKNLKADSDRTVSLAAAAKTLFDEASNDMATKKANMENAMSAHAAAKKKCSADSDESVAASAVKANAVKVAKDSEVIDKELALIAQLKAKLVELTNTKSLQTDNLQSSEDITKGVNSAILVASAGARPETALVIQALQVAAGRQFQESNQINELLDQLIAKLQNEKTVKRANVVKATKRAEDAKKVADSSCAASDAKKQEAQQLTNSFESSVRVVDTRREEHNTIKALAATALKSFNDFQASFESEKATMARVSKFFNGGMKCSK